MKITLLPGAIQGPVGAIPSKSHLHRLLIMAAVAEGETVLRHAKTMAEDIVATRRCLEAMGASIREEGDSLIVRPIDRHSVPKEAVLDCGESGSTLRFLLPMVAALGIDTVFNMEGRLPQRPMSDLEGELCRHGCTIRRPSPKALHISGRLTRGDYRMPGNVSSQYITGLLLALPLVEGDSSLTVSGLLESEDYVTLTRRVQDHFQLDIRRTVSRFDIPGGQLPRSPGQLDTEGDWSNAAFWLCAGAMPGGKISCEGLAGPSSQGDRAVTEVLAQMGAQITREGSSLLVCEGERRAVVIDAAPIPDLIPPLAAVAATGSGVTRIINAGRLRLKESDRLTAVAQTLNALGAHVQEEAEGLLITGRPALTGGIVDSWGDHRIAMMAAIASAACREPVTIHNAQAVNKSYPGFWPTLATLNKIVQEERE